jgi:hypothetical protein
MYFEAAGYGGFVSTAETGDVNPLSKIASLAL